ncbi:ATP-binding protein, partial [Escherichia coli]|uniref:ATP-binding protein n=1 Tax=Escherichia coli TaxID=562 RepID=UPI00203E4515
AGVAAPGSFFLPSGFSLLHIKEEPAEWRGLRRPAMRLHRMLTKQLQKIQVLILDDLGLEQLSNAQCNDLLELIEDRYGQSSTIV